MQVLDKRLSPSPCTSFSYWFEALVLLSLISTGAVRGQALQPLEVIPQQQTDELPLVLPEFPGKAYLVFVSSISDLAFESNWIIRENLSQPDQGRYVLVVDTVRQVIRVSSPARYRARDVAIPDLTSRQTLYFSVEPVVVSQLQQIRRMYEGRAYEEAVNRLNAFVLIEGLTPPQRANAYQLLALCFYRMGEEELMKEALARMLDIDPFRTPDVVNPEAVAAYIANYQDSVRSLPPSMPIGLQANLIDGRVFLSWEASDAPDFAHYRVYKSLNQGEESWRMTSEPVTPGFLDAAVEQFQTYSYRVTAVDDYRPAQESSPSGAVTITVIPELSDRIEVHVDDESPIKNVSLHQLNDSLLAISYRLQGALKRTYDIYFPAVDDTAQSHFLFPRSAEGDIGIVSDGLRRQIIWPFHVDYPDGLQARRYRLDMRADARPFSEQIRVHATPDSLVTLRSLESKNDSKVVIGYELQASKRYRYDVEMAFEKEGGAAFLVAGDQISGDLGPRIKSGRERFVEWKILETFPDGLDGNFVIRLRAEVVPVRRHPWRIAVGAGLLVGAAAVLLSSKEDPPVAERPVPRPN